MSTKAELQAEIDELKDVIWDVYSKLSPQYWSKRTMELVREMRNEKYPHLRRRPLSGRTGITPASGEEAT